MINALFSLIPVLAGMAAVASIRNPRYPKLIAAAASAVGLALACLASYGSFSWDWFSIGGHAFAIDILVAPLNFMLLVLVMFIGTLVMIYSAGYMSAQSEQRRFYIELLAFEAAMALFSISGGFITLFIAWEFLSLTSYLLIGFWHNRDRATRAARKVLIIIFLGDLALLGSIVLFWNLFATLSFTAIMSSLSVSVPPGLYLAVMLLLIAIFTKSAQFPFHEWLIDAMEGPTPVSAYLHSSTMVKAGVFAAVLLFPIFQAAGVLYLISAFGIVTAVISTLAALREFHIKKVIAYSTVQELSIMLVAIGSGALLAAIYFFFVQTFYKSLLFFTSGNVMEATGRDYINEQYGLKSNRLIYLTTLAGVLSLAGFIPFSGFLSTEGISVALSKDVSEYLVMSLISFLTSVYIFRWFFYPSRSTQNHSVRSNYLSQPKSMVYPMALLALLTLAASAAFVYMPSFMAYGGSLPFLSGLSMGINIEDSIILSALVFAGAAVSYIAYARGTHIKLGAIGKIMYTNPAMTFAYGIIASFIYYVAEGADIFDSWLSSAFDYIGHFTMMSATTIRRVSAGDINLYALAVVSGIICLFAAMYFLVIV